MTQRTTRERERQRTVLSLKRLATPSGRLTVDRGDSRGRSRLGPSLVLSTLPGPLGTPALVRTPFVVFHGKVQRRSGRQGSSRGDTGAWGQRSKSRCRPADPFVSLDLSKRQLSSLAVQATLPETVLTAAASLQCRRGQRD